jgi:hypothetical protein
VSALGSVLRAIAAVPAPVWRAAGRLVEAALGKRPERDPEARKRAYRAGDADTLPPAYPKARRDP